VKDALFNAASKALEILPQYVRQIHKYEDLRRVAINSCANEEDGTMVAKALSKVGPDGLISLEMNQTGTTQLTFTNGVKLPASITSPYMQTKTLHNVKVLVTDGTIKTIQEILPILEDAMQNHTALLLVADDYANEVINALVLNRAKTGLQIVAVRSTATTDCAVITLIPRDEELDVVEVMGNGWIKFMLDDEEAYVSGDFVKVEERLEKAATLTELLYGQGVSNARVDLVQYAKQFIGNKYVWGGTSLTNGVDCSGFTMRVYEKYGISLPHYSVAQSKMGRKTTLADIQPGDLVFYAKNGTINHVAIYIGGGQVVHASNERTGIKISSVNYRTPAAIRSFLG